MEFIAAALLTTSFITLTAAVVKLVHLHITAERTIELRRRIQGTPVPVAIHTVVCETLSPGR